MSIAWKLSWRFFRARHKQKMISLIGSMSILGVALGVMALIVVLSVMGGFDRDLKQRILGVYSSITIQGQKPITDFMSWKDVISQHADVKGVSPIIMGQLGIRIRSKTMGVIMRGIYPVYEKETTQIGTFLTQGKLEDLYGAEKGIVIGQQLADRFRINLGDKVTLISPISLPTPFGLSSNSQDFKVVGIFHSGMYEYDLELIFIALEEAQKLYGMSGAVHGFSVEVKKIKNVFNVKQSLQNVLPDNMRVKTWLEVNQNLFRALITEKWVMFWILLLIVLVAVFNIASTLIMIVMEKTKDIGVLKALGMDKRQVIMLFIYQGLVIGILGTLLGYILGVLLTWNLNSISNFVAHWTGFELFPKDIYYLDKIPTDFDWFESSMVAVCSLILCFLASLYPAYQATRLEPIQALRYE